MKAGQRAMTSDLFRLNGAVVRDAAVEAWLSEHDGELGAIARHWFR
ncbi:hypothetical protein [Occallatibacter riparius]|uniref:Uncharacterized protein n=1 Tax=Occallatibacter riparius TaxID=1002689 RepID=A0A9J7BKU4_9BACT|nr:hypothetical protein [Occallatibacter riparius]UWZ82394.1 hypothetical protein MOP44_17670 [Occallatibacter riparius]